MTSGLLDPLGWARAGEALARSGRLGQEELSNPTVPGLLNLAGVREIDGPLRLTWRCCGIYEVLVSGGGSAAEVPAGPSLRAPFTYEQYPAGRGSEALLGPGTPLNPLSWEPTALVPRQAAGPCVELDGKTLCVPRALPWSPARDETQRLPGAKVRRGPLGLGFVQLAEEGDFISFGQGLRAWVGTHAVAAMTDLTATLIPIGEVELRTGLYDVDASILYPLRFVRVRLRPGDVVEANVVVLRGASAVSMVSPRPFRLQVSDGVVTVKADDAIYVAQGGEVQAFRALLEAIVTWEGRSGRPLGRVEPGPASIVLHSIERDDAGSLVRLAVMNPTGYDAEPELRLNFAIQSAEICSHLGCFEVPGDRRGLLRVPAPSGCYCTANLRVRGPSKP